MQVPRVTCKKDKDTLRSSIMNNQVENDEREDGNEEERAPPPVLLVAGMGVDFLT